MRPLPSGTVKSGVSLTFASVCFPGASPALGGLHLSSSRVCLLPGPQGKTAPKHPVLGVSRGMKHESGRARTVTFA